MGIRYKDSPFYCEDPLNPSPGGEFDRNTLEKRPYPWALNLNASYALGYAENSSLITPVFVRTAAQIAEYFWAMGRLFKKSALFSPMPGDIVFITGQDATRFRKIKHVGIVSVDTTQYYNAINDNNGNQNVIVLFNIPTSYGEENGDVAFFGRPFYEKAMDEAGNLPKNFLEGPWQLDVQKESNKVVATPHPTDGYIWTGTFGDNVAVGNRTIYLGHGNNKLYLPAGTYHLSGAPTYHDNRASIDHVRWGIRIYYDDDRLITYMASGQSGDGSGIYTTEEVSQTKIIDRGFGAEFTLAEGAWLNFDIYIYIHPAGNNIPYANPDTTIDLWKPKLIRTD